MGNKIAKVIDPQNRYLRHLTDGIMAFWIKHGPDTRHGGFYGGLDRKGNPSPSLPKGLVQHARFLWSFEGECRGEKGSIWKTPYHTARACIELVHRLNRLRKQMKGETRHD